MHEMTILSSENILNVFNVDAPFYPCKFYTLKINQLDDAILPNDLTPSIQDQELSSSWTQSMPFFI